MKTARVLLSLFILLFLTQIASADIPAYRGFVNDFAGVMDQRSIAEIQLIAEKLQQEQGIELAVVTVQSTAPDTPFDYGVKLFNDWGIGGEEDSGLLLLLAMEESEIRVEVGYGLEPVLTDGKVGAILDSSVLPHLQQQQWGRGLAAGASAFRAELSEENFAKALNNRQESSQWLMTLVIFLAIAIFISIQSRKNPPSGPSNPSGRRRTGMGPIYTNPRFPSGGKRGGGFGGFGGGRSGGGGAGRKF